MNTKDTTESPISELFSSELRKFPCLSNLNESEISKFAKIAKLKRYKKSEILFQEKDNLNFFYIVHSGRVKLYKTSTDGRELLIKFMEPGDYFCCAALLSNTKAPVSACAAEESTIIQLPANDFKTTVFEGLNELGLKIVMGLCRKISHLSKLLEEMSFKDVNKRIAMAILRICNERFPKQRLVSLNLTHQELALMTGTVREVVSRSMAKFKKDKIIVETSARGFTIDVEKLSQFMEFSL